MPYKVLLHVDCHLTGATGTLTSEEMRVGDAKDMVDTFDSIVGVEPEVVET